MIRVTNIQRMCFDDGPGIRTTVFLKGCSIHCPWCSNPENITFEKQEYSLSGDDGYIYGSYGIDYKWEDLLNILWKDYKFWGTDGGVTFSGGEALLQAQELELLMGKLKEVHVSVGVETALFVPKAFLDIVIKYIDFYYVDVKILGAEECQKVLGGNVNLFLDNVEYLSNCTPKITFRVPCSQEYVLKKGNRELLCDFFSKYKQFPVEIFSVHNLGDRKYQALNMPLPKVSSVSEKNISDFRNELELCGVMVKIIRI